MESQYKIIKDRPERCEARLNNLKKDYNINVISMSSCEEFETGLSVTVLMTITPKQE